MSQLNTTCTDHVPDALVCMSCYLPQEHELTQQTTMLIYLSKMSFIEHSAHIRWLQFALLSLKCHLQISPWRVNLPSWLFPWHFSINTIYVFQISEVHPPCHANTIQLNLVALTILRDLLQPRITIHFNRKKCLYYKKVSVVFRGNV